MIIELRPLNGAVIDEKEILLGMEKKEVEALLGEGDESDCRAYYFDSAVCIEYDEEEKVDFIEVSCDEGEREINPVIYGISVLKSDAKMVYDILKKMNRGRVEDVEKGYSYAFLNISVGVFREMTPDAYKELEEEMEREGKPIHENPDLIADLWKSTHWSTVGIGTKGCYDL